MTGPPLDELQEDYRQSQQETHIPEVEAIKREQASDDTTSTAQGNTGVPVDLTSPRDVEVATPKLESEVETSSGAPAIAAYSHGTGSDEDDDYDDMIKGVYFEDGQGNVIIYENDDDDEAIY